MAKKSNLSTKDSIIISIVLTLWGFLAIPAIARLVDTSGHLLTLIYILIWFSSGLIFYWKYETAQEEISRIIFLSLVLGVIAIAWPYGYVSIQKMKLSLFWEIFWYLAFTGVSYSWISVFYRYMKKF